MTDGINRRAAELRQQAERSREAERARALHEQVEAQRIAAEGTQRRQLLDQFTAWARQNKIPFVRHRVGFSVFKGWQVAIKYPEKSDSIGPYAPHLLWVSLRGEAIVVQSPINPMTREVYKYVPSPNSIDMFSLDSIEQGIAEIVAGSGVSWS